MSFTEARERSPKHGWELSQKRASAVPRPTKKACSMLRRLFSSLIALTAAPAAAATSPTPPEALRLEPYDFVLADGSTLKAERGRFLVPEDRDDAGSRKIEIGFVRFRSTNPDPGAPIVYLAGGPGGSGVGTARGARQPVFLELRKVADVIAFDQRGTGFSNHIPRCTAERRLDPIKVLSEATVTAYYLETLRTCIARWTAAGVAVRGYTTVQSAHDLEDLRRALGAAKIDLWGISYGTHLAFAAMRQHPNSIGRVALASAEGMDQTVKLPSNLAPVYGRIDAVAGGGLVSRMHRVHARFDAAPQAFSGTSAGGTRFSFRTDSFALRLLASSIPKNPEGIPRLVATYAALESGRTAELGLALYNDFYADPLTLRGMGELMDIASGVTRARMAQLNRELPGAITGTAHNFPMPQLRGAIKRLDLGDRFRRDVVSNHPVLLFSGDLDVRTPIEEQELATAGVRNLHRIVVRNGGHDLFEAHPDVPRLLKDFFQAREITTREILLPADRLARVVNAGGL
jgi:pimeloyl-ACP methyl ester carboxylesterase